MPVSPIKLDLSPHDDRAHTSIHLPTTACKSRVAEAEHGRTVRDCRSRLEDDNEEDDDIFDDIPDPGPEPGPDPGPEPPPEPLPDPGPDPGPRPTAVDGLESTPTEGVHWSTLAGVSLL